MRSSTTTTMRIRRRRSFRVPGTSSTSAGCTSGCWKRWGWPGSAGSRRYPNSARARPECDADTLRAVITHRYYVLAQYTRSVRNACRQEISRLERRRRRAQRSGDRCELRCRVAALVAPAHLASKSAPTADVRPGIAQGAPAADRLFDATGAECALEPIQRHVGPPTNCWSSVRDWRAPRRVHWSRGAARVSHAACRIWFERGASARQRSNQHALIGRRRQG